MSNISGITSPLLAGLLMAVAAVSAEGQSDARTRVTIRGTGNDISIERIEAAVPETGVIRAVPARGPMAEAIRMKRAGAEDWEVVSFLRANVAALPSIIDFRDVKEAREAGAGKSVISYLESVSAVDIGPTAEPGQSSGAAAGVTPEFESGYGLDALDGGYPLLGGIGAGSAFRHSRMRPLPLQAAILERDPSRKGSRDET